MKERDISPGVVLYLRQQMLVASSDCKFSKRKPNENKVRPYVCLDVQGFHSVWTSFTSSDNRPRLHIAMYWREGGFQRWRFDDNIYLWDGSFMVCGPTRDFCRAAQDTELLTADSLARLNIDGLHAVRREAMKQKIRRPHWFTEHCAGLELLLSWRQRPDESQAW